jgi:isochorismate hydrolase
MPVIAGGEEVVENIVRLLKFARIVGIPIVFTEQEKLGPTLPQVRQEVQEGEPVGKVAFDSFSCEEFASRVRQTGKEALILTGVEAHVCVMQTALHALPYIKVHVVSDAVSSRRRENWSVAIERMRQAGAVVTSTEMVMFELLRQAGTDEFRAALPLIK